MKDGRTGDALPPERPPQPPLPHTVPTVAALPPQATCFATVSPTRPLSPRHTPATTTTTRPAYSHPPPPPPTSYPMDEQYVSLSRSRISPSVRTWRPSAMNPSMFQVPR